MGKTHLIHPAFTQLGPGMTKQKKEVRRVTAREVTSGDVLIG